jgi:hypothetical protein
MSSGHYELPCKLLKDRTQLTTHLTFILNRKIPDSWKTAKILMRHKKAHKIMLKTIDQYQIVPSIAKIFKKCFNVNYLRSEEHWMI